MTVMRKSLNAHAESALITVRGSQHLHKYVECYVLELIKSNFRAPCPLSHVNQL